MECDVQIKTIEEPNPCAFYDVSKTVVTLKPEEGEPNSWYIYFRRDIEYDHEVVCKGFEDLARMIREYFKEEGDEVQA